jgi:tetratricopeptide (TPR) repeat protein
MDREQIFDDYLSQVADNPTVLGPVKRLEDRDISDWGDFVWTLEEKAEEAVEDLAAARLYLESGRVALAYLDDQEWGSRLLENALEFAQGTELGPEARLFHLALEEDQEKLLGYFTSALEQSDSNDVRARLYLRMAFILEHLFQDPQEADTAYNYALQLDQQMLPAWWGRERIARKQQDWAQLGELLADEIEFAETTERQVEISVELGELYRTTFEEEEAAAECFGYAHDLDPSSEEAKRGLVELGRLEPDEFEESEEAEAPDFDEESDPSDEKVRAAETSEEAGGAEEELDDAGEAMEVDEDDLEVDESETSSVEPIEVDESVEEKPDEFELSGDEVELVGDGEDSGSQGPPAFEEDVDGEDSGSQGPPAFEEDVDGDEDEPLEVEEEPEEDEESLELDRESDGPGTSHEFEVDDVQGGDEVEISDEKGVSSGGEHADQEASTVGESTEGDEFAGEVVEEEDEQTDDDDEMVELSEGSAVEAEEAISEDDDEDSAELAENSAVEVDELDEESVSGDDEEQVDDEVEAVELDDGSSVEGAAEESQKQEDQEVVELTEDSVVEENNGAETEKRSTDWSERLASYCKEAEAAGGGDESVDWLVDAARLEWLHRGDEAKQTRPWEVAVDVGVAEQVFGRAHFMYFSGELWEDIRELLAEAGVGPALLGRVVLFHLGDVEGASELAEEADDESLDQAIEDIQEAEDNWRRFQRSLDKRHSDLPDDEKALEVYGTLANLARGTDNAKKEVDALRRLDRQVEDPEVKQRLMVCYRQAEKWPMYVDLVKEQAERFDESRVTERVDWLLEAVRVYRDEMNHDMMVVNTYKEILEIDPENIEAVDSLVELYDEMNRSSELINALQQKAELVDEPEEKIELHTRVADLFLDKFRNQAEAIKAYEEVLEIEPHHEEALDFLTEMYEKRRDWKKLVDVRRRAVEGLANEERVAELKEIAELASEKLRKPDVATELWGEVREVAPEDRDALDALEDLYEKARAYQDLADVVEEKVGLIDDDSDAMELYQKLGMLYSDRLEEPDAAIEAWERALEIEPDDRKARKAVERLYTDNHRWDDLEDFYAERGEHRELVRMMDTLVGTVDDDEVKIGILLRAARVWRTELDEVDRAKRNLERALDIDGRHEGVAQALEPIYREEENWEGLREVLVIVLDHQDESEARKEYQIHLAELHKERLDAPSEAFDWYAQALSEAPSDADVVEALEGVAGASERWTDLVDVYESVLADAEDPDIIENLRLNLGRVLFDELERTEPAVEQFESVLERDEENVEALAQMEKIHREAERWDDLMGIYRRRLDLTDDDAAKIEILRGIAEIAEIQKQALPEAIERLNEALELGPENEETLRELHRLHREQENHEELAEMIQRQIDIIGERAHQRGTDVGRVEPVSLANVVDPDEIEIAGDQFAYGGEDEHEAPESGDQLEERSEGEQVDAEASESATSGEENLDADSSSVGTDKAVVADGGAARPRYTEKEVERLVDLRYELGTVLQQHLDGDVEAVDALSCVLRWRPGHQDAREAIERYLDDPALRCEVAEVLEPLFAIRDQWERHVDVLEIQVEETEEEDQRIEFLEEIARVQIEEIGSPERSFEAWGRVVAEKPTHETAREQLTRIAEGADLWQRLAELLEDVSERIDDEELRRSYLFELGSVYADRLEAPSRAEAYYQEILEDVSNSQEALDELQVIYARTERWRDLLDVFDNKLEFADEREAIDLLFRKAVLWDQLLEQPHEAIDVLQAILEEHPENIRAVRALSRLYEDNGMWEDLADVVERELEVAGPDRTSEVKKRLADIYHERLGDDDRAVDLLEEVLEDNQGDDEAIHSLEGMMELETAPSGRISQILEPLYQDRQETGKVVWSLEVQVGDSDDPDRRVELLHRIATLLEHKQDERDEAFDTLARALRDGVENGHTLEELYRLADDLGGWERLVGVFREQAEVENDPDVRRDLLTRAADVYLEELDEPSQASPLLHQVLEIFPSDLETAEKLDDIYRELEDWEALVDILRHRASHVEDPKERKELLYQAGNIYDEILERPEESVDVYREVLDIERLDVQAIDRLQELFTRLEWWEDLLEIYDKKLELAGDDQARRDLLYAVAPIYEDELEQPYEAIETYRDILEIDSGELAALESIADLYEQTEQWHELLDVFDEQIELVSLPEEELGLKYEAGRTWETELGDVLQAVDVYREILDRDPEHERTREALADMIERGEAEVEAAEVLAPIYEASEEWKKLVHVQKLLIEASHDPDRQLELYREVGDIYEEKLENLGAAFETYLQALDVAPDRKELLNTVERLAGEVDGWETVIERFDELLAGEASFETELELNRRVGRILDDELGDVAAAIERYEDAREIEPEHPEVTEALDQLYQDQDEWEKLADILQTRIYIVEDPERTLELRSRLGLLYQNALDQPEKAVDTYQNILEERPENEFAIRSLEEMFKMGEVPDRIVAILEPWYVERDRHEKLVELYLERLERLDDSIDRFELFEQVGGLYLDELDQPERALQVYGAALAEQPDAQDVADTLERLAQETDSWEEAAGFYYEAIEAGELLDEEAIELWSRLAGILDQQLDQIEDAEAAYRQILELDPGEPDALEALDRICEQQSRWEDLAEILNQRLDHTYDEEVIVEVNFRLAQIYQHQIGDVQAAVDTYRDLLDVRPIHREALEELVHIHREREEWEELVDVLDRKADATNEPEAKIDCFGQMATIAEQMLERPLDAIDLWNRVLELEPEHEEALQELGRLYYDEQRWDELVGIVERELELTDDPEEKLDLYKSVGTVWGEKLGNEGPALDAWRNVLDIREDDLEALRAVRELYTRQGDYEELAPILERLIEHQETAEAEQLELWIELAEIRGEMLLDTDAAIEAWQEVISLEPNHDRALDELEKLYLQETRFEEAAQVLEIKVERIDDELEQIDVLSQIADIWEHKLESPDRAAAFYEQILELDPSDMQASRSLEDIYREQATPEAYQSLVGLYLDRAEEYEDRPFDRMEALRSAARVFEEELDNAVNALVVLVSAFDADTYQEETLEQEIERLARSTDQWNEPIEKYQEVIRELGDSPEGARLHEKVGEWYAEELDQPDDAIYHLRRALDIDPQRAEILETLEQLYDQLESWPELAQVLGERIERAVDPDTEIELWRKLGELYELKMEQLDEAIDAYWEILQIDEADLLAIESLERIYESKERWEDLIEILERKVDSTYDPDDLVEIRVRIARIWEEQLGELDRAIATYETLLADEPDNEQALEALERLYFETGQWHELLGIYDERLRLTHEPEEQVTIYGQSATIYEEQLDQPLDAVDAYDQILMVDPENTTAMQNLERLYTQLEQWFDLVDILQRHIEAADDDDEKIELLNELARIQKNQVDDPYAAVEAYERSLGFDSDQPTVLFDLAELHRQTSNWESAVEAFEDLLEVLEDPEDQLDVHFTVAQLLDEKLANDRRAETHYSQAWQIEPDYTPAREALEELYERNSNWEELIDLFTDTAEETMDLTERARFLARAGSVYEIELDDRRNALDFYERALEEDPKELEAAEPLVDLYLEEDEWERAVPLLDMAIEQYEQTDGADSAELQDRYVQLARVYEGLEQDHQAIDQYWNAYELDRDDVEVLLGLGRLLFEQGDYEHAADIIDQLETKHGASLETDELVEMYYRAGKIQQEFGNLEDSIEYFEEGIQLDGYHEPTLEALVDVNEEAGYYQQVVEYKRRLLELTDEEKVRFALLTDIGELSVDETGDMEQAIEAYLEALDIKPQSVAVLRKLLEIYKSTSQWHEAVNMLDRLIEQQVEDKRRAKFNYTAAIIFRDKIGDPETAIQYFEKSLDADITKLESFEAIDRILTELREWKELERGYRRMLRRIAEGNQGAMEEVKFKLWEGLGEIYRTRLGHPKSAIQAFQTATQLKPHNERVRLILAELYEKTGENPEGVIEQHKALIEEDPFRIDSYKALFRVYLETNQYDRAWCVSAALTYLEKASDEERRIYEQYRGQNLRKAKANLDQEAIDKLYHPDQDMLVTTIMSVLNQGLREMYADDIQQDWGLHPGSDQLDLDKGTLFANVYNYVAGTVNLVPVPEVYLKKDQAIGLRNANVHPPALVAGADVVQNTNAKELAFRISKLLGGMRSEHYLGSIGWPTEVLKMFFLAAMHVTKPELGVEQKLNEQGLAVAQHIQNNMPSQMQMQLQKHVSQYLKKGENPDLSAWLRHVEHTINRVGMLLCGDLQVAAKCIKADRSAISKASVKEKIQELVLFVISDEYTELRERLGLAIG